MARNPTIFFMLLGMATLLTIAPACENADRTNNFGDDDADGTSGTDGDTDGDTDDDDSTDSQTYSGEVGTLTGQVMAPSSTFPIPGALVYLTPGDGSEIPDGVFCYECEDMTGRYWTLSLPDGSWTLENVPAGNWNIVTRKGFFQRQRAVTVAANTETAVPIEDTTLPRDASDDGKDKIPNYAVLLNGYDLSEDLLGKLGMGELGPAGHLLKGTESFTIFNDVVSATGYQASSTLFQSQDTLNKYHMVFFPCICNRLTAANQQEKLREYVIAGGKIYASCWASQWAEQPFPAVIEFSGDDNAYNAGDVGSYQTNGSINDPDMAAWLQVVAPGQNINNFPFEGAWIKIDSIHDVDNGFGLEEDNGVVKPYAWVTDVNTYSGSPMTVTYNYGCGKVFYSVYQVVESAPSPSVRPQEYVLLYVILEVGVCEGEYIPPV